MAMRCQKRQTLTSPRLYKCGLWPNFFHCVNLYMKLHIYPKEKIPPHIIPQELPHGSFENERGETHSERQKGEKNLCDLLRCFPIQT